MSDEVTTKWYSITGAPIMEHPSNKARKLVPISARFTFVDRDPYSLAINAEVVRQNDSVGERCQEVPSIYIWDRGTWPAWLDELWTLALNEVKVQSE